MVSEAILGAFMLQEMAFLMTFGPRLWCSFLAPDVLYL